MGGWMKQECYIIFKFFGNGRKKGTIIEIILS
jgi:hypothetical protein